MPTKAKLYYVFLPKLNVWKIGCTSASLKERMKTAAVAGIDGYGTKGGLPYGTKPIEGVDYIVLFLREYSYATAYKYESAIKRHNKDCRVPKDFTPLISGNTELFWMDIGDSFINSIPESDL